jgi:hypothetical protein
MKKLVRVSFLFGIVALVLLMAIGSAAAAEIEEGTEPEAAEATQPGPSGTATRIDFELSEDSAREGLYVVKELEGTTVATWYALDGWEDSGWLNDLYITRDAVHVQVLFYPGPDTEPTVMKILNPAGGTEYGWLAHGVEHALEVEFPAESETMPDQG